MDATILLEAAHWLVADKPPGVTVIPARSEDPGRSLRQTLERERGERLWVVHRIDRDTSGVVLFARDAPAHRALSLAFEGRAVRKRYLGVTRGVPTPSSGTIAVPLHTARKGKMRPAALREAGALAAATDYRVRGRWDTPEGPVALVELHPRTGRQHQIRVHLRAIGTPLLADPLYGGSDATLGLERLALHAAALTFPDPATGCGVTVEAPLPPDLAALLARLDRLPGPETRRPPG